MHFTLSNLESKKKIETKRRRLEIEKEYNRKHTNYKKSQNEQTKQKKKFLKHHYAK